MSDRELLPVATPARVRAVLADLLRVRRVAVAGGLVALLGSAGASMLTAPLLGRIVDVAASRRGADAVTGPVLGLVGAALGQGLLALVGIALVSRAGEGLLADLRERFVDRALHLPLARLERAGSGDLTARVGADLGLVGEAVREAVPAVVRGGLVIALTLVGLAVLDGRLLLAALLAVPVQVLTARWYLRRSTPLYSAERVAGGAQQQQLLDSLGGVATVRALRLHDDHARRVRVRADEVFGLARRVVWMQTGFFARLNLAEYLGLAGVLAVGFGLLAADAISIGTAGAAALYVTALFTPINEVLFLLDTVQAAGASLARVVGVADLARPARTEPGEGAGIRVRDAHFSYDSSGGGHEVLRGVDLDVPPGAHVALVGASGAGKSTLAALVAGVHRPTAGTVAAGRVGLVTQEVHVFAGTLADDLRLAAPDADDDALAAALDRVGARAWAEALPDGTATVVGSGGGGGHALTAAQAQQLALARLLLADPPIAVLDEATAEAGSAGARVLEQAAEAALAGRTALVVAHRLSQAARADRIVVLDAGVVVEEGTHDELLAAGGRYAGLWASAPTPAPSRGPSGSRAPSVASRPGSG